MKYYLINYSVSFFFTLFREELDDEYERREKEDPKKGNCFYT